MFLGKCVFGDKVLVFIHIFVGIEVYYTCSVEPYVIPSDLAVQIDFIVLNQCLGVEW